MEVQFGHHVSSNPMAYAPVCERETNHCYLKHALRAQAEEVGSLRRRLQQDGPIDKRSRQKRRLEELTQRTIPRILQLLGDDVPDDLRYLIDTSD